MDAKDRNQHAEKSAEDKKVSELPARDQNAQSDKVKGGGGGVPGRLKE